MYSNTKILYHVVSIILLLFSFCQPNSYFDPPNSCHTYKSMDVARLGIWSVFLAIPNFVICFQAFPVNYSKVPLQPICQWIFRFIKHFVFVLFFGWISFQNATNLPMALLTHVKAIKCQQRTIEWLFVRCKLKKNKKYMSFNFIWFDLICRYTDSMHLTHLHLIQLAMVDKRRQNL